ncbi:GTP-binding protein gtr2 [Tilletia horrida]|nr:GTP-binding protein gtr2 [Tilletia horrida]
MAPQQNNVVVLGRTRAGKTSIIRTLVDHLDPNDAIGEDPTTETSAHAVESFIPLTFWDTPGMNKSNRSSPDNVLADQTSLPWSDVCALVYVIDAQDMVFHTDLSYTIADAYEKNPRISIHIFVHKIDGHSDEYSLDVAQSLEESVEGELRYEMEVTGDLDIHYHLTSIYDSSIFVAFSRVIRELMKTNTFTHQLDDLCDRLNSTCSMERTYIFDVPNRLYLAADNSPSDGNAFSTMSAYLKFLLQFSGIYSHLQEPGPGAGEAPSEENGNLLGVPQKERPPARLPISTGRYASSTARLTKDISLAFWQLNNSLALVSMLRTDTYAKQAGLLEYNIAFFRRGVTNLYELAQLQGPVLNVSRTSDSIQQLRADAQ